MASAEPVAFAGLLSRFRLGKGLTQEELAERAGMSARGVSDLERGLRAKPRAYTVHQLAEALQLGPHDRALFEAAAYQWTILPGERQRGEPAQPTGNFLGALPEGPLIAREEELDRIRAMLDTATGAGQLLLLAGERGIGKTRLAQETMLEAQRRGFLVLTGRCYGRSAESPFAPIWQALAELERHASRMGSDDFVQRYHAILQLDRMGVEVRLFAAVSELLTLQTEVTPVALLLDDLQRADAATIRLLHDLTRSTRSSRIFVLATYVDTRVAEDHPDLAEALQDLARERLAERITLRRLTPDETTVLAASFIGQEHISDEFGNFLHRRSKGNPRFVEELVRSLGGRLEIEAEIGAGAMGRVFAAYDTKTDREVAAKVMLARTEVSLESSHRFQQEGAMLASLSHPNIVQVYDTFIEEHATCIIMERVQGQSLRQLLQDGPLSLTRAKRIAAQVAAALSHAHQAQIVHRDVKPDNVMVTPDDQVKVTDFGIARTLKPDITLETIATTGMRMGTPLYMAPEQIQGKRVDGRADIYGLGAVLFHMVTGRPPFEGSDALAVAVKHLQDEPPRPSEINPAIPNDWDGLILKAMAKDPSKRFQSAREMNDAIDALGEQAARRVLPAVPRRSKKIAAVASTIGLTLAVVAGVWAHAANGPHLARQSSRIDTYLSGLAARQQFSGTVLVAQKGTILLDQGYGLADRKYGVHNSPTTKYPVGGVNSSMSLVAALKLEEQGKLKDGSRICSYLSSCPKSWRPITIHMVLDGTSGLPNYGWGDAVGTTATSLARCETEPLMAAPGSTLNYQNCTVLVLGTIFEKVTGKPWESVMRQLILGPAGMRESGRVTDRLRPPAWAREYSGSNPGQGNVYQNDYFQIYSTAKDIDAYDTALFGGRLVSQRTLQRLLAPRDPVVPADSGIANARIGYKWRIGTVFGHRVIYTAENAYSFTTANFRLPLDDVTVVVNSNDEQNDVEAIAVHLAGLVVGKRTVAHVSSAKALVATIKVPHAFGAIASSDDGALWVGGDQGAVMRIDPSTSKVVAMVRINDPTRTPGLIDAGIVQVAGGSGQVWVTDRVHKMAVRIDPATNHIVARVAVGIEPFGLAIAGNTLWVGSSYEDEPGVNTIVRVDLRTQKVADTITNATTDLGEPFLTQAATPDALWFSDWAGGTIKRLGAASNKVVATIHAGLQPSSVAVGDGAIWTSNHFSNLVTRIDPATNKVVATIPLDSYPSSANVSGDCCGGNVAVGAGGVWAVAGSGTRVLVRIDPQTNQVTASLTFPQSVGPITVADGSVWVESTDRLYRIDPTAMKGR